MKKNIKNLFILTCLVIVLVLPYFVFAAASPDMKSILNDVGNYSGYNASTDQGSMPQFIGQIINIFLSILGIIFIILMLYGGYVWMMAQGGDEEIRKAKDTLRRAIIGLLIVVGSYGLWKLIFSFI